MQSFQRRVNSLPGIGFTLPFLPFRDAPSEALEAHLLLHQRQSIWHELQRHIIEHGRDEFNLLECEHCHHDLVTYLHPFRNI